MSVDEETVVITTLFFVEYLWHLGTLSGALMINALAVSLVDGVSFRHTNSREGTYLASLHNLELVNTHSYSLSCEIYSSWGGTITRTMGMPSWSKQQQFAVSAAVSCVNGWAGFSCRRFRLPVTGAAAAAHCIVFFSEKMCSWQMR